MPNLIKKIVTVSIIGDGTRTTTDENQDLLLIPSDPESHPYRENWQRKRKKKKSRARNDNNNKSELHPLQKPSLLLPVAA